MKLDLSCLLGFRIAGDDIANAAKAGAKAGAKPEKPATA